MMKVRLSELWNQITTPSTFDDPKTSNFSFAPSVMVSMNCVGNRLVGDIFDDPDEGGLFLEEEDEGDATSGFGDQTAATGALLGLSSFASDKPAPIKRRRSSGSLKSQDQLDRRRQRNRVLARKTRLRKKFFFESLQRQVSQLAHENELLKDIVRTKIAGDVQTKILSQCSTELPDIVSATTQEATYLIDKADASLMNTILVAQRSYIVTDPSKPDNPIIFASQGFLDLTGYRLEQVLGRNCRFLQGPKTDKRKVEFLRKGIENGIDTVVSLLNYKADGTEFFNSMHIAALRDISGKIVNYVGVCVEIKAEDMGFDVDDEDFVAAPKKGRPRSKDSKAAVGKPLKSALKSASKPDALRLSSSVAISIDGSTTVSPTSSSNSTMSEGAASITTVAMMETTTALPESIPQPASPSKLSATALAEEVPLVPLHLVSS